MIVAVGLKSITDHLGVRS